MTCGDMWDDKDASGCQDSSYGELYDTHRLLCLIHFCCQEGEFGAQGGTSEREVAICKLFAVG